MARVRGQTRGGCFAQVPARYVTAGPLLKTAVAQAERSTVAVDDRVPIEVKRDVRSGNDKCGPPGADVRSEDIGGTGLVEDIRTGPPCGQPVSINGDRVRRCRHRGVDCVLPRGSVVLAKQSKEATLIAGRDEPCSDCQRAPLVSGRGSRGIVQGEAGGSTRSAWQEACEIEGHRKTRCVRLQGETRPETGEHFAFFELFHRRPRPWPDSTVPPGGPPEPGVPTVDHGQGPSSLRG